MTAQPENQTATHGSHAESHARFTVEALLQKPVKIIREFVIKIRGKADVAGEPVVNTSSSRFVVHCEACGAFRGVVLANGDNKMPKGRIVYVEGRDWPARGVESDVSHESSSDSSLCRNFEGSAAEATTRGFRDASQGGTK